MVKLECRDLEEFSIFVTMPGLLSFVIQYAQISEAVCLAGNGWRPGGWVIGTWVFSDWGAPRRARTCSRVVTPFRIEATIPGVRLSLPEICSEPQADNMPANSATEASALNST